MKNMIKTWTVTTLKEDINIAKKSLRQIENLKKIEVSKFLLELLNIDEFVQNFKFKSDKIYNSTKDIEKLTSISQEQKEKLLNSRLFIASIQENINRIKGDIKQMNSTLQNLVEIENKQKEQENSIANQQKTKFDPNLDRDVQSLLECAKQLEQNRKKMEKMTFDDIINENLKNFKKHYKKREK